MSFLQVAQLPLEIKICICAVFVKPDVCCKCDKILRQDLQNSSKLAYCGFHVTNGKMKGLNLFYACSMLDFGLYNGYVPIAKRQYKIQYRIH
jgi:hypothetical protein